MENSNKLISINSDDVLYAIEDKSLKPATHYKAKVWQPKALLIRKYALEATNYIKNLKTELNKRVAAGNETDKNIVFQLFNKEGKGKELYNKLIQYREQVLNVDSFIKKEFARNLIIIQKGKDITEESEKSFTDTFFDGTPPVAANTLLTQFENWVKTSEYRLVLFCNENIPNYGDHIHYSTLLAQSISLARAGQEIEIYAGLGAFRNTVGHKIFIDGKKILLGEYGIAKYKFKASNRVGKHTVPVTIEYTDDDGNRIKAANKIEYTVITCNL